MDTGDLVFGKPVLLQSYTAKSLVNPRGTEVAVSTFAGEEADCVQLIRNDDGTVSIQSMRSKLYLSVNEVENDDDDDDDDEDDDDDDDYGVDDDLSYSFDAGEIKTPQKFHIKLVDECAFSLESKEFGDLRRSSDGVVCKRNRSEKASSMVWVVKEPACCALSASSSNDVAVALAARVAPTVFQENSSSVEEAI